MDESEYTYIKIPYPKARDLHCKVIAPISPLVIAPGIGSAWVTGQYHDPKLVMPVSIRQGENSAEIVAVNAFAYRTPTRFLPTLKLSFGRLRPFSLAIQAGSVPDDLDFGGLPLSGLEIEYGAGDQSVDFSYPNPQEMQRLKLTAETGQVRIEHLGHANTAEIRLNGDGTAYRLDWGGALQRSTLLRIGMSVSRVELFIPSGTAIQVSSSNSPAGDCSDDFTYADKTYRNEPARAHQQPLLTIYHAAADGRLYIHPL